MLATFDGSRRRWRRGKECAAKKTSATSQNCSNLHSLLSPCGWWESFCCRFYFLFYYYCFVLFFSLEGETLELYLLLWFRTWGRKCRRRLIEEPDRHLVGPQYGRTNSTQLLGAGDVSEMLCGSEPEPAVPTVAAGTMGHGPFHCIAPSLTSLAAVSTVTNTPTLVNRSITRPRHTSDRIYWVTLPVLSCGCVCMPVVCVCFGLPVRSAKDRRTLKTVSVGHGQHVLLFLPGAMLNFIFKFYSVNLKSFHCSLNKVGVK